MISVGIVEEAGTRELRRSVLRPELAPGAALPGDEQPGAVHFGAVAETEVGTLVLCTCFVYPDPCPWEPGRPAWHLRQMATLPHRRGEGLGGAVLEAAAVYVGQAGADLLWCNARERAVAFYVRHGFRPHGGRFTDDRHTVPHQQLARELSRLPTASER